jgi:hypothetical protein
VAAIAVAGLAATVTAFVVAMARAAMRRRARSGRRWS